MFRIFEIQLHISAETDNTLKNARWNGFSHNSTICFRMLFFATNWLKSITVDSNKVRMKLSRYRMIAVDISKIAWGGNFVIEILLLSSKKLLSKDSLRTILIGIMFSC